MTEVSTEVSTVVRDYLSAVDAEAPGLVQGLYLIGSVALGDHRPGHSDIDMVAVTAGPVDAAATDALARAHRCLREAHPLPHFDGPYVTWDALTRPPERAADAPYAHEGRFHPRGRFELTPITWQMLARSAVSCRGPDRAGLGVWQDRSALTGWAKGNLDTYWRRWRDRGARLASIPGLGSLGSWATQWGVLGVARQHHVVATGEVISKTDAAGYGLTAFDDRWHRIVRESLRLRLGGAGRPAYRTPLARRRDLLAFVEMVISDALAQPDGPGG